MVAQRVPTHTPSCPVAEQPLTMRACRSALITSSISLQITDRKVGEGLLSPRLGLGRTGSQQRNWVGSGQDAGTLG